MGSEALDEMPVQAVEVLDCVTDGNPVIAKTKAALTAVATKVGGNIAQLLQGSDLKAQDLRISAPLRACLLPRLRTVSRILTLATM